MQIYNRAIGFVALIIAGCGGGGGGSPGTTPTPPAITAPATPAGVSATGVADGIEIDWNRSANADHYNIYWSDSPGVTPQNGTLQQSLLPPLRINNLSDDKVYYAIVAAENQGGESGPSSEVQAQPVLSLPARIAGTRLTPGSEQVSLVWDNQVNADSYVVEWRNIADHTDAGSTPAPSSPFVLTGLTNSATYSIAVAAINNAGQGAGSGPNESTPVAPVTGWATPALINNPPPFGVGAEARIKDIAINDNGTAAIVFDENRSRLVVNHNIGGTWNDKVPLEGNGAFIAVAITPLDDIHIAYDIDMADIFWRRYRNGSWSDPVSIQSGEDKPYNSFTDLASDGQGNVFATWVETVAEPGDPSAEFELWARRFDANTDSWGNAIKISQSVSTMRSINIVAGASNVAMLAWLQDSQPYTGPWFGPDPKQRVVYASRFNGSDWLPAEIIGRNDLADLDNGMEISIDMNRNGSALVTWAHVEIPPSLSETHQIGAARFDAQLGQWSAPEVIFESADRQFRPNAAIAGDGRSFAAWDSPPTDARGSFYDTSASVWETSTILPTSAGDIVTGADESGEFLLMWRSNIVPQGVFVRRLAPGLSTWGETGHLTGDKRFVDRLATSRNGHALVVGSRAVFVTGVDTEQVIEAAIYAPH